MKFYTTKKILLVALMMAFAACSKDQKQSVKNFAQEPDLNGRYSKNCVGSDLAGLSYLETLRFETDSTFTQIREYHTSDDCSDQSVQGVLRVSGRYAVDNDGASQSEGGSIKLDLDKASIDVKSSTLADALNLVNFCGASDYKANEKVEITAGTDSHLCPVRQLPDSLYGVYREDDGKLYLNDGGMSSMSESKDNRPNDLDKETVYIKQ